MNSDFSFIFFQAATNTLTPCQCSQRLRGHSVSRVIYYTDTVSAESITMETRVSVVDDNADMCQRSQQLSWFTRNYFTLEKVKKITKKVTKNCNLIFSKIVCLHSHWLRGHRVGVVNDYADTNMTTHTFEKLWRILTDLKGIIKWKKVLGCVYKHNNNKKKNMETNVS